MHLSKLIQLVREKWPWNQERYPGFPEEEGRREGSTRDRFKRKHVLLQLMKQVGVLAESEQDCDHDPHNGFGARELQRRKALAELMVGILQFAAIEGVTEDDIVSGVKRVLKDSNQPLDLVNDHVE